jgi:hypothetical protein
MRLWYIDASLSPKDVIILVDNSGSMTGTSHEISRHVVNSILETLGSNDFVNVLKFNDTVTPVISCLNNDTLIQVRAQCLPTTVITRMKLYFLKLEVSRVQSALFCVSVILLTAVKFIYVTVQALFMKTVLHGVATGCQLFIRSSILKCWIKTLLLKITMLKVQSN